MSFPSPALVGSASSDALTLQPGWSIGIDDYNMDVLTCDVIGSINSILNRCPNKYTGIESLSPVLANQIPLGTSGNFGQIRSGTLSCSDRVITPGEGTSAVARLTYKGYVGGVRGPIPTISWLTTPLSINIEGPGQVGALSYVFQAPYICQLTEKFGFVSGNYTSQIGQSGNPYGSQVIPSAFQFTLQVSNGGSATIYGFAITPQFICVKDDAIEAGGYGAITQVWQRGFIFAT
jgi:hypothetical protein